LLPDIFNDVSRGSLSSKLYEMEIIRETNEASTYCEKHFMPLLGIEKAVVDIENFDPVCGRRLR